MEVRELTSETFDILAPAERFVCSDYPDGAIIGGDRGDAHRAAVGRPTAITGIQVSADGFILSGVDIRTGNHVAHTNVHTTTRVLPPALRNTVAHQVVAHQVRR